RRRGTADRGRPSPCLTRLLDWCALLGQGLCHGSLPGPGGLWIRDSGAAPDLRKPFRQQPWVFFVFRGQSAFEVGVVIQDVEAFDEEVVGFVDIFVQT